MERHRRTWVWGKVLYKAREVSGLASPGALAESGESSPGVYGQCIMGHGAEGASTQAIPALSQRKTA